MIFAKGNPASVGKPAFTSEVRRKGGWFGGAAYEQLPDLDLKYTVFEGEEETYEAVKEALGKSTYRGATAYYLNHKANAEYNRDENCPTQGRLDMPVLFIDGLYDGTCTERGGKGMCDLMRKLCGDLREVELETGHWVAMERPREVNGIIAKWLIERVGGWWPEQKEKHKL